MVMMVARKTLTPVMKQRLMRTRLFMMIVTSLMPIMKVMMVMVRMMLI